MPENDKNGVLPEISIEHAEVEICSSVRIKHGKYRISDLNDCGVLIINADNVLIDLNGSEIIGSDENTNPDEFCGFGIVSNGHSNITIRNGKISGFKVAIYVHGGENVTIEQCDVSDNYKMHLKSTPEREDGSDWLWPHYNDDNEWMKRYGGGIVLEECNKAIIAKNRGYHSQNGIILDETNYSKVYDNDFSFNSGWGLAMWRSNSNEITYNKFDWCVRGYSHGVYARGQDSTGILVFEQCNDNIFAFNSATHGGDGFFLYAGHETIEKKGEGGCNRNIVYRNDFSHAVANGIEATFSDSNWFIENILKDCNYGVWAGYSYNTWIAGNYISSNSNAGIAIEHGHNNLFEDNNFHKNPIGINLWWNKDAAFLEKAYGKKQNTKSENNKILSNNFDNDKIAVSLTRTKSTIIEQNIFDNCVENLRKDDISDIKESKSEHKIRGINERKEAIISRFPNLDFSKTSAFLPKEKLRGRQYILVDEWGPYDFSEAKIFPSELSIGSSGTLYLFGPESKFTVVDLPEGISIEPSSGKISPLSATKLQLSTNKSGLGIYPIKIHIESEDRIISARVIAFNTEWDVKFFHWEKSIDPREKQSEWNDLLKTEPIDRLKCSELDFQWNGGKPSEKVNANYFGLLATTSVYLPDGDYEFSTISDDGVRVWIDDQKIIDNWTWHGPTEDIANIRLKSGVHRIKNEYFQIDGWSVLSFRIKKREG